MAVRAVLLLLTARRGLGAEVRGHTLVRRELLPPAPPRAPPALLPPPPPPHDAAVDGDGSLRPVRRVAFGGASPPSEAAAAPSPSSPSPSLLVRSGGEGREPPRPTARDHESASLQRKPVQRKIYTYWEYLGTPDPFVTLNLRTWRAHAPPGAEIVLVNDSNIRQLVPDLPAEWARLPYPAVKSDVVRAAVLYHQGGLYMDTDFLVMGSLEKVFRRLEAGWDVVTYDGGENEEGGESGVCRMDSMDSFSSNFMAARRGNGFSKTWWENIKLKLGRVCGAGEYTTEKVCCHEASAEAPENRSCHVPWGMLELLKNPDQDRDAQSLDGEAERSSTAAGLGDQPAFRLPEGTRLFCYTGKESMAPHLNGEVFWQPWVSSNTTFRPTIRPQHFDARFSCQELESGDLLCDQGNWGKTVRVLQNFFGRVAYHLFFSQWRPAVKSEAEILSSDWLLSDLYRRSLASREL